MSLAYSILALDMGEKSEPSVSWGHAALVAPICSRHMRGGASGGRYFIH